MGMLHATIHDSIDQISPRDWAQFTNDGADIAMDRRNIRTLELTLAGQCRIWIAIVRDEIGTPLAAACLSRFSVDALETTSHKIREITRKCRSVWPGFMRFGVLFCGLPVPSGHSHLRFAPGIEVDPARVISAIHRAMVNLARRHRVMMIVWKEFTQTEAHRLASAFQQLGYLRGDVPAEHTLAGDFTDFPDYLDSLQARYRNQIKRSQKKLCQGGYQSNVAVGEQISRIYTGQVHRLYEAVRDRSQYRLECFNADFFRSLGTQFGSQASLTYIHRDDQIVAFAFGLTAGRTYHNLYVGIDYQRNDEADLYFNIHYHDFDRAFKQGARHLHLGQTADDFKTRLGTIPQPLSFFARAVNPLVHRGLATFEKSVFPPVKVAEVKRVFKQMGTVDFMATKCI